MQFVVFSLFQQGMCVCVCAIRKRMERKLMKWIAMKLRTPSSNKKLQCGRARVSLITRLVAPESNETVALIQLMYSPFNRPLME